MDFAFMPLVFKTTAFSKSLLISLLCFGCLHPMMSLANPTQEETATFNALKAKAEAGNAQAQVKLGEAYEDGNKVGKNSNFALKWYSKASEKGCAFANYKIGWFYSDQNKFKEAIPYLEKAAQQGSPNGLVTLGVRYMVGKGVKKDEAKGLALWKQASEKGFGYAYLFIGNAYYHGNGVKVDKALAFQYYDKFATQGDDYAHQEIVANLYLKEGGFINWFKGWYWKSVSLTNQIKDIIDMLQGKTPKYLENLESC